MATDKPTYGVAREYDVRVAMKEFTVQFFAVPRVPSKRGFACGERSADFEKAWSTFLVGLRKHMVERLKS